MSATNPAPEPLRHQARKPRLSAARRIASRRLRYLVACTLLCLPGTWATAAPAAPALSLTAEERAWLADHPVIRFAPDPNFAPVEWFNLRGDHSGITADYLQLMEERLGIRFQIVRGENWNDILARARRREVDALTAIIRTDAREDYLLFTRPYFSLERAIFSTEEIKHIRTLEDLRGYKIAVVKGSWMDEQLSTQPGMSINRFQDLTTALIATSRGVTDVTGSALATSNFLSRQQGLLNLSPVAVLPDKMQLRISVRKDWAPLVRILDKALASISPEEARAIRNNWLEVDEPFFWEKPLYRYTALGLLAALLASMAAVIVWNRTLNARVQIRSRQLQAAQMQLMQVEKMESIGRLAAGVAHEVKNPLAIIQMGADYLSGVVAADNTSREVVSDIEDAVRRADSVIKGLLDFSHNDTLELKAGNLSTIVEEALRLVGHEMRQRSIRVTTNLADVPLVAVDANRVQQVLINVLMNAAHAIDKDGEIQVSCGTWTLPADIQAKHLKAGDPVIALCVRDNGPGISEDDCKKLFDPFFSTKPVGQGTGLGLSVSRNIIELHGGALDICNAPDGGALVSIYFQQHTDEP